MDAPTNWAGYFALTGPPNSIVTVRFYPEQPGG
jgi:hypothetical protein